MQIILNSLSVVVDKTDSVEIVPNGILMNNLIYAEPGLTFIESDLDPRIQQDKIVDGVIVENENYVAPVVLGVE